MAHLVLSLLGSFEATLDGTPITAFASTKVHALLVYLAVEAEYAHPRGHKQQSNTPRLQGVPGVTAGPAARHTPERKE